MFVELCGVAKANSIADYAMLGKLNLPGGHGIRQLPHNPVVKGPVVLKLQRTYGMGDALYI